MRVLAIRGRNLASLDGEFEVDLQGGVLGRSGLFAITGPTGSGKSTLLDALSVALYGKTPRLSGHGGVQVGTADTDKADRIGANDPRSLLRRGRGDGFAEVDFIAIDGHAYRSRWSVRRARGSATGRLQGTDLELTRVASDTPIGRTKTEVLAEIQQLVGLDLDQFRRSVLLAQGDFAAFLHAKPDEQAALLERMTGTEIYARLSRAAFERAKAERRAIHDLRTAIGTVEVLDDEARAELEEHVAVARAAVESAAAVRDSVKAQHDWLLETARAEQRVEEAEQAIARHQDAVDAAEDERKTLQRLDAVRPLRPRFDRWKEAEARLGKAEELAEIEQAKADVVAREATAAERRLAGAVAALGSHLGEVEDELSRLEQQLADAGAAARVEPVWDDVQVALESLTKHEAAVADHAERLAGVEARVGAVAKEVVKADAARATAQAELTAAEEASKASTTTLDELDRDALETARNEAQAALQRLERRAELHERWQSVSRRSEELVAERERASAQAEENHARVAELEGRLPELDAAHAQAVKSLRAAEAVQDLEGRRVDLVDGEPCPLCGATEHPYAHDGAVHSVIAVLRDQVRDAEAERTEAREERAHAASSNKAYEQRAVESAADLRRLSKERDEVADAWRATFDGNAPEHPVETPPEQRAHAEQRVARTEAALDELRKAEAAASEAREAVDEARSAYESARSEFESADRTRTALDLELTRAKSALQQARAARDAARDGVERRVGHVAWEETSPADLLVEWTQRIEAFREDRAAKLSLVARCEALGPEHRRARALVAADGVDPAWPWEETLDATEPTEVVERLTGAEASWRAAVTQAEQAATRAATCADAATAVAAEEQGLKAAFEQAVAAASEDVDEVVRLLARPEAESEELRKLLADLDQGLRDARTSARERREALEDRGERRPPVPDLDDAPDWDAPADVQRVFVEVEKRHRGLATAHTEVAGRLQADDRHRGQSRELLAEVTAREDEARVWLQLDALIGSADGKRFRMFAQGLTLDVLLREANHQLRDLARRYRLQRVPGEDLALQVVDADLGDEVRAISSLSGGESFLVSLALALGLASMTSGTTPVESLFIDEGFGTLDPESLDLALAALDALQAEGRQVGVISHVQGLAEQIGVQVRVSPVGGGRSRVAVVGPGGVEQA